MGKENSSPLFALDIGTRSVVGLIMQKRDEQYELIDSVTIEHEERTMLDGQIHDVPSVAKVIREVKTYLENRHGPFSSVCVAAAGRSLKTKKAEVSIDISKEPLAKQAVEHLELSAVQQAQFQLNHDSLDEPATDYYCVGYSVLRYSLDDELIGSLLDQSGNEASVKVIATFLPVVVIE